MALQGQMLGRYRVLDALGRGGMARVYRAYHPSLNRYVAIKVLRSDLVEDGEFVARFEREARAVASLRHPNIVQVYDFDVQDDVYYMVMELLEGDSLKTRLSDRRAGSEGMPLGDTSRILLDVLDGLHYAHGEGMVHRDVKPGNILLTQHGRAVLTDFGIAQIIGGTRYTASGALMGTLSYMAPEQGLEGRCDARSDIYSLGVVSYEMLTLRLPFDADTPLAILMKHVHDPPPLPTQQVPGLPQPLEQVVLRALAKKPSDRFADAREMAAALRTACDVSGIDVPPRIAVPRSFRTAAAPLESVAVLSGTARARIGQASFAVDETDTTLGEQLQSEQRVRSSDIHEERRVARTASTISPQRLTSDRAARLLPRVHAAAVRGLPSLDRFLTSERPGRVARAILSGTSAVLLYELLALWVGGFTGNWVLFSRAWPVQLVAAALGLAVTMYAARVIWLLIPSAILLGTGLLAAYSQLIGSWAHWAFLWPLEAVLVGGSVWITLRLAHQEDGSDTWARPVGCVLGMASTLSLAIATAAAIATGLAGRLLSVLP
jgi:serine/threonine protein kinase